MDKTPLTNVGIDETGIEVHRLPDGLQPVHDAYGLWICKYARHGVSAPSPVQEAPRYFEHYAISHMIEGRGFYWVPERGSVRVAQGDAVVVCPGHTHCYGGDGTTYVEDTVCFSGPIADHLARCGVIQNGIAHMGSARRLLPIIELAIDPSVDAQIKANIALQNLLVDLYLDRHRTEQHDAYRYIQRLTERLRASPETRWTVLRARFLPPPVPAVRLVRYLSTCVAHASHLSRRQVPRAPLSAPCPQRFA